jgi:hypothetical protein
MGTRAFTRRAQITKRLAVEITVSSLGLIAEWSPAAPDRLNAAGLRKYRRARDAALAEMAEATDLKILLIDF